MAVYKHVTVRKHCGHSRFIDLINVASALPWQSNVMQKVTKFPLPKTY